MKCLRRRSWRALLGSAVVTLALGCACGPTRPLAAAYRAAQAAIDSGLVTGEYGHALQVLDTMAAGRKADGAPWERDWARARRRVLGRVSATDRAALAAVARPVSAAVPDDPGEWAWMRPALERQLQARRRVFGDQEPATVRTQLALARIERTKGDATVAFELDLAARAALRAGHAEFSPELAAVQQALARDYKLGSVLTPEPERCLDTALVVYRALFGEVSPEYSTALLERANIDRWRLRSDQAIAGFERALALRRKVHGSRSPEVAEVLGDLSLAYMQRTRWDRVEALAREAVAIGDAQSGPPSAAHALALHMHGMALRHVGRYAESRRVLERAIELQELRRRAVPEDALVRTRFHVLTGYVDLAATEIMAGDSLRAWYALERGWARGWLERQWKLGRIDSSHTWDGLFERVQASLPDTSAVIGWLDPHFWSGQNGHPSWGFVIRHTGPVRWVRMEAAAGDPRVSASRALTTLRGQLMRAAEWPFRVESWDELQARQRSGWELRFKLFEPLLIGVHELRVVSPEVDFSTPLEVLEDDRGRLLGDRFAISYTISAVRLMTASAAERDRRVAGRWSGTLIAVRGAAGNRFAAQAAEAEVTQLASRLRAPLVLRDGQASETRFRSLYESGRLGNDDLLHIATHGRVSIGWVDQVWLALGAPDSSAERASGVARTDGRLHLGEMADWRMSTRLVTLASCQSSGFGHARTEGVIGLGRAFLDAGCRSVIVTMWAVDDEAALQFTHYLYAALFDRGHAAVSIAEAMRIARRRLREHTAADGSHPYAHPMHWGAFVLLGDPG